MGRCPESMKWTVHIKGVMEERRSTVIIYKMGEENIWKML
jgi:hypothetical protein